MTSKLRRMTKKEQDLRPFYENEERIPDDLLLGWIARIQAGERGKSIDGLARAILRDFNRRQWLHEDQSAVTMEWLVDVLEGILDHQDPLKLMGLMPRKRSRPPDPRLAIQVAFWLRATEEWLGYTPQEAIGLAADCFRKDAKTIERYRAAAADWASGMSADLNYWKEHFMARRPSRPLPQAKDKKSRVPVPTKRT